MRIRWKTLLILFTIMIVLMFTLYTVTQVITFDGITKSENKENIANAQRFLTNLRLAISKITTTVRDWGSWDDTYSFIENNNTDYIESNMADQTFLHLSLNTILFFNQSRQLVYGKFYDFANDSTFFPAENVLKEISAKDILFNHNDRADSVDGLILLDGQPMMIATRPILQSSDEGPSRGTLIMGRFFDQKEMETLTEAVGLPLSFCLLGNPQMPKDYSFACNSLSKTNPVFSHALNETYSSAYVHLTDLNETPIMITRVDVQRNAYIQGKESLLYSGLSFAIIGLIIFVASALLLEGIVLSRLDRLDKTVSEIRKTGDDSGGVFVSGHDELSRLGGNIDGMLATIRESRKATLEAEKKYRLLFDQAPLGILVVDPKTTKSVEFNKVACEQLGYSGIEFGKLSISDYQAADDIQNIRDRVRKIQLEGGCLFETQHRTKTGEIKDVLINARPIELSGKELLLCTYQDITQAKSVEHALVDSEAKYRLFVELAQEGVWAFNNEFETVFVNARMADMFGYTQSEMYGRSFLDFVEKSKVISIKKFLAKNKEVSGHYELAFVRKDNSIIITSIASSLIKDDEGKRIGVLALVDDITERVELKRELERYSKSLEELVEAKTRQLEKAKRLAAIGELAGMVGHDLRNPMTAIKTSVYFLKKKNGSVIDAGGHEMLKVMDNSIEHANRIITDLLDYSREIHLELVKCSPKSLVDYSLSMIQVPGRITIVNETSETPTIFADSNYLGRVFINMIKNAFDAMPISGVLKISNRQVNGNVEFIFEDNGVGISDEILGKIFVPLFTTKAQGMGFGLSICKRIVEAHGGQILVSTVLEKGTKFTVSIPVNLKLENVGEKTWVDLQESSLSTTTKT